MDLCIESGADYLGVKGIRITYDDRIDRIVSEMPFPIVAILGVRDDSITSAHRAALHFSLGAKAASYPRDFNILLLGGTLFQITKMCRPDLMTIANQSNAKFSRFHIRVFESNGAETQYSFTGMSSV
jgi:hypothetical protein